MLAFINQCAELIILGRVQFRVHVGFISAFSCRPDICICFTYNLQAHLHFTLKTQAGYIRTMYNSHVLIEILKVNALETSAVLIEIFNDKSKGQASSGTSKFAKYSDKGQ